MTNTLCTDTLLNNFSELFAAVPHLVGFYPEDSLVLIAVNGEEPHRRFGLTVRTLLPDADDVEGYVAELSAGALRTVRARALVVLVVAASPAVPEGVPLRDERPTDAAPPGTPAPPYRDVVEGVAAAFRSAGIDVVHSAWTAQVRLGQEWLCYAEDQCRGEICDPEISLLGTVLTVNGCVTYWNRGELEKVVASESDAALARRSAALDVLAEDTEQDRGVSPRPWRDCEKVFAAIRRTAEDAALTEDDLLEVLLALSDPRVRDFSLSAVLDDEIAGAAERLWTTLVRKAPQPELADVASLLAISAYMRGDGALAGVALARIEETRPEHQLGLLLRRATELAIPVDDLERIIREAASDARTTMDEGEAW